MKINISKTPNSLSDSNINNQINKLIDSVMLLGFEFNNKLNLDRRMSKFWKNLGIKSMPLASFKNTSVKRRKNCYFKF